MVVAPGFRITYRGAIAAFMSKGDWNLILPYLQENERLFGISVENDLLTVDDEKKSYEEVYIKVRVPRASAKGQEEAEEEY